MMRQKLGVGFMLLALLSQTLAWAQPIGKHPRVAELEDRMIKDASTYLKGRFPDVPFLVSVSVDPLRRSERPAGTTRSERLPFFEVTNDEIQDEWDDPQVSLSELMLRVKRVVVSISIPKNVSEQELIEIREAVFNNLHLVQARDEIKIERRSWSVDAQYWMNVALLAVLFAAFLGGIFLITRKSVGSIVSAIGSAQLGGGGASMPSTPMPMSGAGSESGENSTKIAGGVKISDPIKLREVVRQGVQSLVEKGAFPNLRDIVELDKLGSRNAGSLGALVTELPLAIQKKLFGYSYLPHWMNAFNEPGELEGEAIQVLQRLEKNLRVDDAMEWESLLICVWRLGDQRVDFVKGLKQEDAFAVLHAMPKSIAVPTARKAFPGSWGVMLDPQANHKSLSASEIREITRKALELKPLNDFSVLEHFRHDADLLEYLRTADVLEEREIYEASPQSSVINKVRAPFYRVLELEDATLKEISQVVPMDQWVLALFNVPRPDRKRLVEQFSEKQQFLFLEMMKRMDSQTPDKLRVGVMRERIAQTISQYLARKNAQAQTQSTKPSEAPGDETRKAA
jgi:hypothetical protein